MAPRTSLLTAGTTPTKTPTYTGPRVPITTKQKFDKAAADKAKKEKNVPREKPVGTKPKAKTLLPPGEELFGVFPPKAPSDTKKSSRYSKPITTLQKFKAAEAKAKAKDPYGAAMKEQAKAKTAGRAMKRGPEVKPPGTIAIVHAQDASALRFEKPAGKRNAVMYRRTARAEKYLADQKKEALKDPNIKKLWESKTVQAFLSRVKGNLPVALRELAKDEAMREKMEVLLIAGVLPLPGTLEICLPDIKGQAATFRLMDLPKELRLMVYESAVVEPKVFIRPDSRTGREQPDLAMTCKEVRGEVLPVFYGKNVFSIDLTPTMIEKRMSVAATSGIQAVERWIRALPSKSRIESIRNWVFDYAPLSSWSEDDDGSVMAWIHFDVKAKQWSANVEVHQEASCILPGFAEHGTCVIETTPTWLQDLVIEVCDSHKGKGMDGGSILALARAVKERVHTLVESRCETLRAKRP